MRLPSGSTVTEEIADHTPERMVFKLPRELVDLSRRDRDLPLVEIFTDGACRGNPGPGGWAALLRMGDKEREICRAAKRRPPTTGWS